MFDHDILETKFARIGARLKLSDGSERRLATSVPVSLDVRSDRKGEFFEVIRRSDAEAEVEVLDVQPADRHLLLMVRERGGKSKYLCGHDERHWFVAAVPEAAPVGTVRAAKEALKPPEVRAAQARKRLRAEVGNRRKNAAYRRQGEWFFIPAPGLRVGYWTGGEAVYVSSKHQGGLTEAEYRRLLEERPDARNWGWRVMGRNAEVYVRGRIRHVDHRTIMLHGWHRVLMNTENQSKAMRNVAFLD